MANRDLLENLFESMDLLINTRLKDLKYDKTELCTIEEVKGNNEYYVSNGAAKYTAYAQRDATYRQGTSVYVTIPQGDYNNQKLIVGKYTLDTASSINWVSPMEDFVDITGNVLNNINKVGLIANDESLLVTKVWPNSGEDTRIFTQYDRLCISADFSNSLIKSMAIGGNYGLIVTGDISDPQLDKELEKLLKDLKEQVNNGTLTQDEYNQIEAECNVRKNKMTLIFDSIDMIGNPYDFSVPYKQEKMFEIAPTSKISNLQIYFYQGLVSDGKYIKSFYGINNELIKKEENCELFVENISLNFGYSFNTYKDETAILYTLDDKCYTLDEKNRENKPNREMQLRWVHFEDDQVYSITDLTHSVLKDRYVKVHWYHYDLTDLQHEDDLAGYFWKEIEDNIDKFHYTAMLNPEWTSEKFKVIIECDNRIISSEILEFTNPSGNINASSMITGLVINYPENDEYKGTFYIYGDDHLAGFSTERTFDLIADYKTLDNNNKYWDNSDVICWKFPKENTMIHKPEEGFEYFKDEGDVFLDEGEVTVNGFTIKGDDEFYYILRKIQIVTDQENKIENTELSRTQSYRVLPQYVGTAVNNTIQCSVYKPTLESTLDAEISFTFGLHTTNGTKYTLAIAWEEVAKSGVYQCPPAITQDDTKSWTFSAKILDVNQREIEAPEGGWPLTLSWHDARLANPTSSSHTIAQIFDNSYLNSGKLVIKESLGNYTNYINFAQYGILKISIEEGAFDYVLTTFMPIPIRKNRDIVALEGADRIYYDSSGYNPRWNSQEYKLLFKKNKNLNVSWGLKTTQDNYINGNLETRAHLWTQMPRLDINKAGGKYLVAPKIYLPPADNPYNGICVYAKELNTDNVLWVQPIFVTMDPYGSQFLNEWDGSLKIDEKNGVIMSSIVGAGKKNSDNSYSGVILGEINKVLGSQGTVVRNGAETGIIGLYKGIPSFTFRNDGTATLGQSGAGQIQLDGNKGYIMSSNFDGFLGKEPTFDANGFEEDWQSTNASKWKNPTTGTYLGLSSGRAWFAGDVGVSGTIYSSEGNIGGWEISSNNLSKYVTINNEKVYTALNAPSSATSTTKAIAVGAKNTTTFADATFSVDYSGSMKSTKGTIGGWTIDTDVLSASNNNKYTFLKRNGSIGVALGSTTVDDTGTKEIALYHDGTAKFGYIGGNSSYKHAMTISAGGKITGYNNQWSISTDGKATFNNATIYGSITGTSSINISYRIGGIDYWLTMNQTSKHPNVSGLNVGWGGAHSTGGFSTTEGLTADGTVHAGTALSTAGYIKGKEYHICDGTGKITDTGADIEKMYIVTAIDTDDFSIIYKYRTLEFTKGLLTSVSSESGWTKLEGDWLG